MTRRINLIFGLLCALPVILPSATHGADEPAHSIPSSIAVTSGPSSTWKTSGRASTVDIRFRKPRRPEGFVFTDLPTEDSDAPESESANVCAAPSIAESIAPAVAAISSTASGLESVPTDRPAQAVRLPVADITNQPAIEPVKPDATASTSASSGIAPSADTEIAKKNDDDGIQLVTRLLMDQGVVRAAQEEPLPTSPDAVNPRTANGGDPVGVGNPYSSECCPDQCCPQPCLFWVGGVEATFLVPDLNSDGVAFQIEDIQHDRFDSITTTQDDDIDSMYISPRIWLGVQGCAWGANIRYWHLQASEGSYDPSLGGLGTWDDYDCGRPDLGFFSCNRLEAYTVDLEITRRFCLHNCWMQAAIGVRHAEIENHENITGLALTDAGLLNGFARADRVSRGTGLLLGLYGRKPIFPCSCVHWFYNARWSAMWGPTQTSAETFASAQSLDEEFVASAASVNGAYTNVDDTLFVGEIQLGLEWNYALTCVPANSFFRVAIEYQRWDGGRGFSGADSFAGIEIDDGSSVLASLVGTSAAAGEPQMDLLGFTIGTGLTW